MKLVTFHAGERTTRIGAATPEGHIVDLNAAYALYLRNVEREGQFYALADARVPSDMRRFFENGDYRTATPAVVVVDHELWQRRLHGAPNAIGTVLTVNDQPVTVIGVAEPGFAGPAGARVWMPRIER